ncbi:MAG: TlpA family protein disulfide reductase [Armatimonadetes bacterium]|jgi:peroxiredoxin|nr:TlpA family protein disulfide reductase [Armatimonadota bacterium]
MRRLVLAAVVLALTASAGSAALQRGKQAPAFTAKDVAGKAVKLSDFKGKKHVLLMFWSTTCPVSTGDLRPLAALQEKFKGKPLAILGVNTEKIAASLLSQWSKEQKVPFRVVRDADRAICKRYQATATPVYYLISKDGTVQSVYTNGGQGVIDVLTEDVAELLRTGKIRAQREPKGPVTFG